MQKNVFKKPVAANVDKDARRSSILPFTEQPSGNREAKSNLQVSNSKLDGTELFSLFTADIIREDVVFTR